MNRIARILLVAFLILLAIAGCKKEKAQQEEEFSFVVYPGARYLPQMTDLMKQAHRIVLPGELPPIAIYDTDAPLDDVAQYYARSYGYDKVAPDVTNNLGAVKPPAYRRSGDLQADAKAIQSLLPKLGLHTDISRAQGPYVAVELAPKTSRPRVTIQRPYFDVTSSQVVDRTLILMVR